ncbi:MAG: phasin family protein [Acetobacteraceae bacterium]|nr:phasin family protein [Acetobacteraceae bacterium]
MTETQTKGITARTGNPGAPLVRAKETAISLSGALTAASRAYVNGILDLGRTLGGFGREIAAEAGRQVRATIEARNMRELAELQAAWVQHRVETSTAQAKELADLAHAKAMDVIAPFASLLNQDKAA